MCIIYSSYIQHLTNKQRKTDYWKKHRWKWGTTKVGAFFFSRVQVGSYVCSTRSQITARTDFGCSRRWTVNVRQSGSGIVHLKKKNKTGFFFWGATPAITHLPISRLNSLNQKIFRCEDQSKTENFPRSKAKLAPWPWFQPPIGRFRWPLRWLRAAVCGGVWSAQTWTLGTVYTQ